jgi:dTDP-4-amino-4,6-dideoxygalactose transaminase
MSIIKLENLEIKKLIKRPSIPNTLSIMAHMYYLIVKNNQRNKLIKYLKQKKINTVFHYIPLHNSPFGRLKTKVQIYNA